MAADKGLQESLAHDYHLDIAAALRLRNNLALKIEGHGLDPNSVTVIVVLPFAAHVLKSLWDHFLLPRLLELLGRDAILPKQ